MVSLTIVLDLIFLFPDLLFYLQLPSFAKMMQWTNPQMSSIILNHAMGKHPLKYRQQLDHSNPASLVKMLHICIQIFSRIFGEFCLILPT